MKNRKLLAFLVGAISFVNVVTTGLTAAWFINEFTLEKEISGSSISDYYEGGTGTKDDPFRITKPRHLYNLAWLQYKGHILQKTKQQIKLLL